MPLGVNFFIPFTPTKINISIFWPLGLLLSRVLKESFSHWTGPVFSHHCPAVIPKKGASCWQCPVEPGCVSYPTQHSGCQPSSRLCDCCLEGECSFLPPWDCLLFLSIAPVHTWFPSPSKALLFPSVGNVLWSIFAEEKVIGKQKRTKK